MALIMPFHSLFSIALAITASIIISISIFSLAESNSVGFSVDLIHRDSQESPFYDHSLTPFERVSSALRRSANRVNYFKLASLPPQAASTEVIANGGEYLMKIKVGTPQFNVLAVADTGSDLIWTQCSPCTNCYKQKAPLFKPKNSSSYKEIPCRSSQCQSLEGTSCSNNGSCMYSVAYGDKSYSQGIVGTETISLGSSSAGRLVSLRGIIFGCGYNNRGTFSEKGSGIVGLGGGQVSFVSQMDPSFGGKFSYCLVPLSSQNTNSSQMHFGEKAAVVGNGVVSTPIIQKNKKTFYLLQLEGLTIGRRRLEIYDDSSSSSSNDDAFGATKRVNMYIIIDSGTTLTYLPSNLYNRLELEVRRAIKSKPIGDPEKLLNLCYRYSNSMTLPIIIAHFTGANVKLNPMNTFVRTGPKVVCLAFAPSQSVAIFGNVAQMNFLVGYDLKKRTVSFKPTDCAKE